MTAICLQAIGFGIMFQQGFLAGSLFMVGMVSLVATAELLT